MTVTSVASNFARRRHKKPRRQERAAWFGFQEVRCPGAEAGGSWRHFWAVLCFDQPVYRTSSTSSTCPRSPSTEQDRAYQLQRQPKSLESFPPARPRELSYRSQRMTCLWPVCTCVAAPRPKPEKGV